MKDIVIDFETLSERADEIDVRKQNNLMREIILALKEVIRDKKLLALSAPQIGYPYRIFCINFKGDVRSYINPIITSAEGFTLSKEKDESIPGKEFIRPRNNKITIMFQDPLGKAQSQKLVGVAASTFQRMVDHLDGLLLTDIGLEIDQDFYIASEKDRLEVINAYLDSIDQKRIEIQKEISKNSELKSIQNAAKFMNGVKDGSVKLGEPVVMEIIKNEQKAEKKA